MLVACLLVGGLTLVALGSAAILKRVAEKQTRAALEARDLSADWEHFSIRGFGRLRIDQLRIESRRGVLRCAGLRARLRVGGLLTGRRRFSRLTLTDCAAILPRPTVSDDGDDDEGFAELIERGRIALREAASELGSFHVNHLAVQLHRSSTLRADFTELSLRAGRTPQLRTTVDLWTTDGRLSGREVVLRVNAGPVLTVVGEAALLYVHRSGWDLRTTRFGLDPHGRIYADDVALGGGSGASARLHRIHATTDLRTLSVEGGAVRVATPDRDALPEALRFDEGGALEDVRLEVPDDDNTATWGVRVADNLYSLAAALLQVSATNVVKDRSVSISDIELTTGNGDELRLHVATADRSGVRLHAEVQGAELRVSVPADRSERADVEIDDVPLSPFAGLLSDRAELGGRASIRLAVTRADTSLDISGSFTLSRPALEHPLLSPRPVHFERVSGTLVGRVDPESRSARLSAGFDSDGVPFTTDLSLAHVEGAETLQFSFSVAGTTPCQEIWDAIPDGLLPAMGHGAYRFSGSARPSLRFEYTLGDHESFRLHTWGFPRTCRLEGASRSYDPRRLLRRRYVHHVNEGVTRSDIYVGPGTSDYVRIDTLPSYIPALMYLSEEIDFYRNPGISVRLIAKAVRYNLPRRRFAYGGSTVTQQLVKNLFFSREKTLARKFEEAIVAWAVEDTLTKDRILELYMNCIEFGPNLYGIVRASRHYFGKEPAELSPLEAAWLASLKPSPIRGRREWRRGRSAAEGWNNNRLRVLMERLVRYGGHIDEADVAAAAPWVVHFPTSENYDPPALEIVPSEVTSDSAP